jgi:hypothetical protein
MSSLERQHTILNARIEELSLNITTRLSDDTKTDFKQPTDNQTRIERQTGPRFNLADTRVEVRLDRVEARLNNIETLLIQILAHLPAQQS